ncbi:hypothetical protein SLEP1_g26935 [Rubroshorea leprosula]|uniref:Uncharacterized protein n=1 Tax=Rubroshorea leprosula TaxID=152421 RepID=A0AAV5JY09_9ROSI|nr:hypothetical protein SLEP1_g26935 [Rubroshorea leprosula]
MAVNLKKQKRVRRIKLDSQSLLQVHRYILFNTHEVTPFIKQPKDFLKKQHRSPRLSQYEIERCHSLTFHEWFRDLVTRLGQQGYVISKKIKCLSKGPSDVALTYSGYLASKVFYIEDAREKDWQVVKHVKVRSAFDLGKVIPTREYEVGGTDMASTWVRRDTEEEGIIVTPDMDVENYDDEEMDD